MLKIVYILVYFYVNGLWKMSLSVYVYECLVCICLVYFASVFIYGNS